MYRRRLFSLIGIVSALASACAHTRPVAAQKTTNPSYKSSGKMRDDVLAQGIDDIVDWHIDEAPPALIAPLAVRIDCRIQIANLLHDDSSRCRGVRFTVTEIGANRSWDLVSSMDGTMGFVGSTGKKYSIHPKDYLKWEVRTDRTLEAGTRESITLIERNDSPAEHRVHFID